MTKDMRINLTVPYAEKDQAKQLGARWDAARRTWFVENVANLEPLLKWMPDHLKQSRQEATAFNLECATPVSGAKLRKMKKAEHRAKKREEAKNTHFIAGPVTPRTDFSMFDPGCSCVPWEWCEHNPEPPPILEPENLAHIRSILAE